MLTDKQTKTGQTDGRNYTNFERNLAMMVIYLHIKIEFDWNGNVDGQTNGQTNGRNYCNFKRNLAMMVIYLPVKLEFDWTKCF